MNETYIYTLENVKLPLPIPQVWTELADGGGATNFITGMGGYLQSVLFGYGGLRMYPDRIDFNCTPVPDTTGFTIRGKCLFVSKGIITKIKGIYVEHSYLLLQKVVSLYC